MQVTQLAAQVRRLRAMPSKVTVCFPAAAAPRRHDNLPPIILLLYIFVPFFLHPGWRGGWCRVAPREGGGCCRTAFFSLVTVQAHQMHSTPTQLRRDPDRRMSPHFVHSRISRRVLRTRETGCGTRRSRLTGACRLQPTGGIFVAPRVAPALMKCSMLQSILLFVAACCVGNPRREP